MKIHTIIFLFARLGLFWPRMNPVALITGASRGIGRGISLELAGLGWDLVINYASNLAAARQAADLCVARATHHGKTIRAEICEADIGSATGRRKLIEFARTAFGRLDLLVNNAGVAPQIRADILEASEESFDRLLNINVKGPYFLTQLAAHVQRIKHRTEAVEAGAGVCRFRGVEQFGSGVEAGPQRRISRQRER